jgi:hypothetical protein
MLLLVTNARPVLSTAMPDGCAMPVHHSGIVVPGLALSGTLTMVLAQHAASITPPPTAVTASPSM